MKGQVISDVKMTSGLTGDSCYLITDKYFLVCEFGMSTEFSHHARDKRNVELGLCSRQEYEVAFGEFEKVCSEDNSARSMAWLIAEIGKQRELSRTVISAMDSGHYWCQLFQSKKDGPWEASTICPETNDKAENQGRDKAKEALEKILKGRPITWVIFPAVFDDEL